MFIPKEAERLMEIYNSVSEKEFAEIIKNDDQAKSDLEVTSKWLEREFQPFINTIKEIAEGVMESLEPLLVKFSENPEALNVLNEGSVKKSTFSLGA